jgi:hypothetical protein
MLNVGRSLGLLNTAIESCCYPLSFKDSICSYSASKTTVLFAVAVPLLLRCDHLTAAAIGITHEVLPVIAAERRREGDRS